MQVQNFSLNDSGYSEDYASEMISLGVAEPLREMDDVIAKFESGSGQIDKLTREDVFTPFQPRMLNF
jgi:hypothetical protein